MKKKYVEKMNVHYYLLFGISVIVLGCVLFVINSYGAGWINLIPGHSAPIIASLVLIIIGVLLIIAWIKNIRRGIYSVSS